MLQDGLHVVKVDAAQRNLPGWPGASQCSPTSAGCLLWFRRRPLPCTNTVKRARLANKGARNRTPEAYGNAVFQEGKGKRPAVGAFAKGEGNGEEGRNLAS